jgi:hypothetical protein
MSYVSPAGVYKSFHFDLVFDIYVLLVGFVTYASFVVTESASFVVTESKLFENIFKNMYLVV